MEDTEIGDFSHPTPEEDDILRYLMDAPSDGSPTNLFEDSTPDSSPPHMFEDSTPEDSPSHWSQDLLTPPTVPQLSELSLDLNPELLLYGSNINPSDFGNFMGTSITGAPTSPPKEMLVQHQIPLMPIVQPPSQVLPIVQPPHVQVPIVVEPPPKKNRASGKKRPRADLPSVPSPQEQVALPRDTLLNITSQSMERYVETLQSTRQLSTDDQKELKRQKRLIKNRESAQLSRERKRAYIDQLEARIAQLVADNGQLKTDNTSLRQALARYQPDGVKTEPTQEAVAHGKGVTQAQHHLTKMGNLLTVGAGSRSTATAGVCLLIVLFSFGLFMNVNRPNASSVLTRFGPHHLEGPLQPSVLKDSTEVFGRSTRAIAPDVTVGFKRGLLEAFPEVKDEENDTEPFEPSSKFPKAFDTPASEPTRAGGESRIPKHVIRLAGTNNNNASPQKGHQHKFAINNAGIFKVSYTPEPASFIENNGEHSHEGGANSTFHLFLDPRPDLDDMENDSVSATHETQLEVATPRIAKKDEPNFPPMIISLVFPEELANGSNPLRLPEGLNPSNSLMEITCQVIDISITTSERPPSN